MYTKEQLIKNPYFAKILENEDLPRMLDSLTGVLTRPYIIGFIRYLIDRKIPFTAAMLDLDNFKFINDTYGHKVGDGVLQGVSNDMIGYLEDFGFIGRFGGDEFIIITKAEHELELMNIDKSLRTQLNKFNTSGRSEYQLSFSVGKALFNGTNNIDSFLNEMDDNMYSEKKRKHCRSTA